MRSLDRSLGVLGLVVVSLVAACAEKGGNTDPTPTPPNVAAPKTSAMVTSSALAAAPLPKPKRPKTRESPNPQKMSEYRQHLSEGRRLSANKQFPEALKEFDAALAIVPGDAPVLVEKSFAAMKAGELDKAKKAGEDAIRRTTSPKLKAMAHYNLGRVAEGQNDLKAATAHYRKSITLRPNESVEKRLAELEKKDKTLAAASKPVVEELPCQAPVATLADVCKCLSKPGPDETEPRVCEPVKGVDLGRDDLSLVELTVPIMTAERWIVGKSAAGFVPVRVLSTSYNPGAFGIFEEFGPVTATKKMAGKTEVVWIESTHDRHDSDMGLDEYEEQTTKTVTLCIPPAGDKKAWTCPVRAPLQINYERDRMKLEGFTPDEETRKLMTKDLPIKEETKLEVKLLDGKAEVKLLSGKLNKEDQAVLGVFGL